MIGRKIFITHEKVNKRAYWVVKNTPYFILIWFKFAKRVICKFFSALFLLLVGSGPKKSTPIEKLDSSC